jgi:hypothetical protein
MRIFMGTAFLFAAACAFVYALHCLYVIFGYRKGNVAIVTATLTNHSVRRNWYANQRWYDPKWTGYIYTYCVDGREYTLRGSILAGGDRLPRTVRIAYQCSDPSCSFIPVLKGPAQLQSIILCAVCSAMAFSFAANLLIV